MLQNNNNYKLLSQFIQFFYPQNKYLLHIDFIPITLLATRVTDMNNRHGASYMVHLTT